VHQAQQRPGRQTREVESGANVQADSGHRGERRVELQGRAANHCQPNQGDISYDDDGQGRQGNVD
jgi:hypothetical protein